MTRKRSAAFSLLGRTEGILPALESAHALAHVLELAPIMPRESIILVCLSGRGDKDVVQAANAPGGAPMKPTIQQAFDRAAENNRAAFIPYMTGAFPDPETNLDIITALAANGADAIEIGLPFSDPVADGPVIQAAGQMALDRGATPALILDLIAKARAKVTCAMVIMSYWNPILKLGPADFCRPRRRCRGVGGYSAGPAPGGSRPVAGSGRTGRAGDHLHGRPDTPPERRDRIMAEGRGFLYYVSVTGVTGSAIEVSPELVSDLGELRRRSPIPVAVGFGVSTPEQARTFAPAVDGVIVGSALIRQVLDNQTPAGQVEAVSGPGRRYQRGPWPTDPHIHRPWRTLTRSRPPRMRLRRYKMILLLDNYDSFTYNVAHALGCLGMTVKVIRSDKIDIPGIEALAPQAIVISPGPGRPDSAGISCRAIEVFAGRIPILGVCLGHQAIGEVFGAKVVKADRLVHGKTSPVFHTTGQTIYHGLRNPFTATRYHSLIVTEESTPESLEVAAYTSDGEVMGLRNRQLMLEGVQFHPESIATPQGHMVFKNFMDCYLTERAAA